MKRPGAVLRPSVVSEADVPAAEPQRLEITLKRANNRASFSAELNGDVIVESSEQPKCDAARVLHRQGFPDDTILIFRHDGANHESMRGPLGVWRTLRVREDKNGPRFVKWEPFPSRRVTRWEAKKALGASR
jgi:hypothetical protein